MGDSKLTPERIAPLVDKMYNLGLKTSFILAIEDTLKIGLGREVFDLESSVLTRAFELTSDEISERLAVDFAEELLGQIRSIYEEDSHKKSGKNGTTNESSVIPGQNDNNTNGNNSTGNNNTGEDGKEDGGPSNAKTTSSNIRPALSVREVYEDLTKFLAKNKSPFQFKGKVLENMAKEVAAKGREIQQTFQLSDDELLGLAAVSLYDIIFLCDDSGSMKIGERIPTLVKTLQGVADWATRLEPKGISLRFLNYQQDGDGQFDNLSSLREIKDMCHRVKFDGGTELGGVLQQKIVGRRILESERVGLDKPLIVAIITDGEPTDDDPNCLRDALVQCKTILAEGSAVFILFQVGNAPEAKEFMEKIAYDPDVEDILYCSRRSLDGVAEFLSETLDKNGTEDSNEYKKHLLEEFITAIQGEWNREGRESGP